MVNGVFRVPEPKNEPILSYVYGSKERTELEKQLDLMLKQEIEIPVIIDGKKVRTELYGECRCPHDHKHVLGKYHKAGFLEVEKAIDAALKAKKEWAAMSWEARASIFLRAAELLASSYRQVFNAATMLGQSKTVFQAEIDAVCELVDFWRFNAHYMQQLYEQQPNSSANCWNRLEWRPLEGFIFAISPFNFTSIAANLATAPVMLGNTVVWKPSSSAIYSAYYIMKLLKEAGLPDGVINMIPGSGKQIGKVILEHPALGGVHFTGSTEVFNEIWRIVGENIDYYKTYPRIVGETGGKDFIFVHSSADADEVATAIIRGAFEYQGQKCSAASRAYIPESLWEDIKDKLCHNVFVIQQNLIGPPTDFKNFMTAVIDEEAFNKIIGYIDYMNNSEDAELLIGGNFDNTIGYFIDPTIIVTKVSVSRTMCEEIFGPVITIYIYPDNKYEKTLQLCDKTSVYSLTGSIMAKDRSAINKALEILINAAGNFYINDKPTGAVVGQQPFGGSRKSGTNDKAGSILNLQRWVSPRTIKETFVSPTDYKYPYMEE